MESFKAIVTFFFVGLFASNSHIALETLFPVISEVYWFVLLLGAAISIFLIDPQKSLANFPSLAFIWIILFAIAIAISILHSSFSENVKILVIAYVKGITILVSLFLIVTTSTQIKAAAYALLLVLIYSVGVNLYDYFNEASEWSSIPGRAAGYYIDANLSASMIIMSLIFASLITSTKFLWPLFIISAVGVILTFSRGGFLELFIVMVTISFIKNSPDGKSFNLLDFKAGSFLVLVGSGVLALGFVFLLFSGAGYELVKDTPIEEYLSDDAISRMNNDFSDDSATGRKDALIRSIEVGLENPVFGAGLSYTRGEWEMNIGPHNTFTTVFAEMGLPGLISFIFLLAVLWLYSGTRQTRVFVSIIALYSLFSHTNLEMSCLFVLYALAFLVKDEHFSNAKHPLTT